MFRDETFLVSGANGLIGAQIVKLLVDEGARVVSMVRPGSRHRLEALGVLDHIDCLEIDLSHADVSVLPENLSGMILLAQSKYFRQFPNQAMDVFNVNIEANQKLIHHAYNKKLKKLLYVSTGGIYQNISHEGAMEEDPVNANSELNYYLASKLCTELLFRNYMNFFELACIVRPFFVFGPTQNKDMLIPRLFRMIKNGEPIILQGEEGILLNPIFDTQAAESIVNILKLKGHYTLNVAGNQTVSLKALALLIGDILGKKPLFKVTDEKPNHCNASIKATQQLVNIQTMDLRAALEKMMGGEGV